MGMVTDPLARERGSALSSCRSYALCGGVPARPRAESMAASICFALRGFHKTPEPPAPATARKRSSVGMLATRRKETPQPAQASHNSRQSPSWESQSQTRATLGAFRKSAMASPGDGANRTVQFSWNAAIMSGVMIWAPCASTTSCSAPLRCTGRSVPFKRANRFAKNGLSDVPGVLSIFCAPPVLRTRRAINTHAVHGVCHRNWRLAGATRP